MVRPKDDPLRRIYFWLSQDDAVTGEDMARHVFITGMTGSGKTSSSGKEILKALMTNGGGIVPCSKGGPGGDADLVLRYARELDIEDDVIVLEPRCSYSLDFLTYAYQLNKENYAIILPDLISTLIEVGARRSGQHNTDPFWIDAPKQMSRAACTLAVIATDGKPSLPLMHEILLTAPKTLAQVADESFRATSTCMQLLQKAEVNARQAAALGDPDPLDHFQKTATYFLKTWPTLPDRTRESILISWEASVDILLRPPLKSLLCSGEINLFPEWTHDGKIIVVNYPTSEDLEVGVFANAAMLYLWQLSVLKRHVEADSPITWAFMDEVHEYLHPPTFQRFQAIARSHHCSVVAMSQNIENLLAIVPGSSAEHQIYSWLQNFGLSIAHANSGRTCEWFSNLIGKRDMYKGSYSRTDRYRPL